MIPYGAWIPQSVARSAGGGELLLGVNYDTAMRALKIKFENWGGVGGATAFMAWAKARLVKSVGVVSVAYVKGLFDPDYDHIMAMTGIETATPAGGYDGTDVFAFATGYDKAPVRRVASGYACASTSKTYTINQAGCMPTKTRWGTSVLGPVYANASRPTTALSSLSSLSEPGPTAAGVTFNATLTTKGRVVNKRYKLYRITALARVPSTPAGLPVAQDLYRDFNATGTTRTEAVSFLSSTPAYFVCVAA